MCCQSNDVYFTYITGKKNTCNDFINVFNEIAISVLHTLRSLGYIHLDH